MNIRPHRRNVGMVFQSYALFPHLTVRRNVAFGLEMRSVPSAEANGRVQEALNVVRLQGFEDRLPHQLSGGQQQRVAIARALVIYPDLLLLDEPLSNLDAKLRQEMLVELVEILERINITTIFVTHDQDEALALADRVVVMNEGRVEQIGTPRDIYLRPTTGFVAKFLGEANVFSAVVLEASNGLVRCVIGDALEVCAESTVDVSPGTNVEVIVRAERVHLSTSPTDRANSFQARVEHVLFLGGDVRYVVYAGNHRLVSVEKNNGTASSLSAGQSVYAEWQADDLLVVAT
jgi:ABC-type Fe3+/spermidine/putrescine transport system ATPase subunit